MLAGIPHFSTAPPIGERSARILIILAEGDCREDLADAMSAEGYEVIAVGDSEEVFRLTAEFEPDLVILGVVLPNTSGYELCGELRAGDVQHQTPVVLTGTGTLDEEHVARGLLAGADDVLDPTRLVELRARVRVQLRNKRYRDAIVRLRHERDSLRRDICMDPLTGVLNRRSLEGAVQALVSKGERFAVLFTDIDHFKSVNDELGHDVGDEVLINVADMLKQGIRPGDSVGRYGGEEFVVLVSGAGPESARLVAERHRTAIEKLDIGRLARRPVTLSVGVAVFEPDRAPETVEELFRRADTALYEAKRGGRNRVVMSRRASSPPEARPPGSRAPARRTEANTEPSYPATALSPGRAQP